MNYCSAMAELPYHHCPGGRATQRLNRITNDCYRIFSLPTFRTCAHIAPSSLVNASVVVVADGASNAVAVANILVITKIKALPNRTTASLHLLYNSYNRNIECCSVFISIIHLHCARALFFCIKHTLGLHKYKYCTVAAAAMKMNGQSN